MLLTLAVCVAVVVSTVAIGGWMGSAIGVIEPTHDQLLAQTRELDAIMPTLQRLGVTDYDRSNDCAYLVDRLGTFTNSLESSCVLNPGARLFDGPATADMATVDATFASTGLDISIAWATDDPGEAPGYAFFAHCPFCSFLTYAYAPGYGVVPADVPGHEHFIAITSDWFAWEGPG